MSRKTLFLLWGALFALCAGLSLIPEPAGLLRVILTLLSLAFFVPPALLLYRGQARDRRLIVCLSALSLGATLGLLVVNFLCALRWEALGDGLQIILAIVSTPMVSSGYWVLSLFLWACLLMAGLKKRC